MIRPIALVSIFSILLMSTALPQEKPTLAILDFEATGISVVEATAISDRLRTYLVQIAIYQVVERGQMIEILKEQNFQLTGCVTTECAVQIGQLLGAQYILLGSVATIGNLFTLNTRIVDVESGSIVNTAAYDYTGDIGGLLSFGMKVLSSRISDSPNTILLPFSDYQQYSSYGRIQINSNIEDVRLEITGEIPKLTGTLPFDLDQLPPGNYKITLSKVGFVDVIRTVEVASMKTTNVFLPLKRPIVPLYKISSVGKLKSENSNSRVESADRGKYKFGIIMLRIFGGPLMTVNMILVGSYTNSGLLALGAAIGTIYVIFSINEDWEQRQYRTEKTPNRENIAYNKQLKARLAAMNAQIIAQNKKNKEYNASLPKPSIVIE